MALAVKVHPVLLQAVQYAVLASVPLNLTPPERKLVAPQPRGLGAACLQRRDDQLPVAGILSECFAYVVTPTARAVARERSFERNHSLTCFCLQACQAATRRKR